MVLELGKLLMVLGKFHVILGHLRRRSRSRMRRTCGGGRSGSLVQREEGKRLGGGLIEG